MSSKFIAVLYIAATGMFSNDANATNAVSESTGVFTDTIILPIKLLEFNGKIAGDVAQLHWKTNNEIEAKKFVVERSRDGKLFKEVGEIEPSTASGIRDYHFTDDKALEEKSNHLYYRLRQPSRDNKSIYSRVVVLPFVTRAEIICYPNPVRDEIGVALPAARAGSISVYIADATGRQVRRESRTVTVGSNSFGIDVADLGPGLYFLLLNGSTISHQHRFIKY